MDPEDRAAAIEEDDIMEDLDVVHGLWDDYDSDDSDSNLDYEVLILAHLLELTMQRQASGIEQPPIAAPVAFSMPPAHLLVLLGQSPLQLGIPPTLPDMHAVPPLHNDSPPSPEVEPDQTADRASEETSNQTTEKTSEQKSSEQEQSSQIPSVSGASDADALIVEHRSSSEPVASTDPIIPPQSIKPSPPLHNDSPEVVPDQTADRAAEETSIQTTEKIAEQKSSEQEQDNCVPGAVSPRQFLTAFPKKKLLILDLNGVLADINTDNHNRIMAVGKDMSKCTVIGHKTLENRDKPLVLKELRKLWHKEYSDLPFEEGDYSPLNTLLVDDSPYKALRNPVFVQTPPYVDLFNMFTNIEMTHSFDLVQPHTGIFPHPYSYMNLNDNSLGPGGDLCVYLQNLAAADDVQTYVRSNPFGQPFITDSDPHWDFYSQFAV
ncbi:hypothetical protein C2845_PM15G04570 [Panicum miliaceum]|uniref:FCP1 homology domain-containing protein n=1 Tax=Panicum miliaceum TaxID=4540 RepID=A0A3L6QAP5_PANMI|nr:hypothetical protein C2845_PM15G04570 [Panicum miliaceum]